MTLTELSNNVKRALPFVALFGLSILIVFYSFKLYLVFLEANRPDVTYTKITFGRIGEPEFRMSTSSAGFNFVLDTIEGVPVTSTDSAVVYFLPEAPTRFGYREKIYLMARTFGFDTDSVKHVLVGKTASFKEGTKTLSVDIGNFNFKFAQNVPAESLMSGEVPLSKTEIINKATEILQKSGRYPDELARGTANVIYLKYDPAHGDFINVQKASEATAVEVDFQRPSINGFSIATPRFFNSQNYLIMNFPKGEINVIRSQVAFFEKSEEQWGVYPVKTGDEAWEKLKAGQGKVVAGRSGVKTATIKKMFISYLDPEDYQPYLQPVYVFLGDNDFVAYVTAVKDEYLIK